VPSRFSLSANPASLSFQAGLSKIAAFAKGHRIFDGDYELNKRPEGELLFKVSLISDTHVNEAEDRSASPYPANADANPRARHIFEQVNRISADFIIHLGDMINPVPELPSYGDAARNFHALAETLKAPMHLMPGNHDIGDKPVSWMPAGMVNAEFIDLYRKTFGRDYFSVTHKGCHFIIINSPLINSGDPSEAKQAAWLEEFMATHAGERMFVFSHYPPYVTHKDEPESYDNIGEPGRSWFLNLIRTHKPEALFSAHVHNFWYDHIGDTEFYVTPSTCFVRHDYSEMYRIDGGGQKGRDDSAKLGFLTLEIHENGHVAHYHRSYGAVLLDGVVLGDEVIPRPNTKTSVLDRVFVDMRHAWAEEMVIAPSGAVDEFRRKKARNDYPVMAMWEMGLKGLRVPLQDLMDPQTRRRMEIMCAVGHRFQAYLYGMPTEDETRVLTDHASLLDRLELVLGWEDVERLADQIRTLKHNTKLRILLSRVNRKDGAKHSGSRFNHLISHGFTVAEHKEVSAFLNSSPELIDGVQFTIPRSMEPWTTARELSAFNQAADCEAVLYVKSTDASPAESFDNEIANARRFAETAMSGIGHGIDVILDTFDDADRGYFTRTGLVDRRFNPRHASELLSALALEVNDAAWTAMPGETPALFSATHQSELRVYAAGETLPKNGTWICPKSGRRGATGDSLPSTIAPLILVKTEARR
jgi:calcineurin-like phosphoesterase family protein